MHRKLISQAISNIDDIFLAEALLEVSEDQPPERTAIMAFSNSSKHIPVRRLLGLALAACLMFALATTAYAADIGGIQRKIQIWRYGDQTTAVLNIQDTEYSLTEEDGSPILHGGGVAIESDGSERPLTEEEIIDHLNRPDLYYKEDGTVWIYYQDQKIEITHLFNEEDVCYLTLKDGEETLYLTITKGNGMAVSPKAYIQPDQFSITKGE